MGRTLKFSITPYANFPRSYLFEFAKVDENDYQRSDIKRNFKMCQARLSFLLLFFKSNLRLFIDIYVCHSFC